MITKISMNLHDYKYIISFIFFIYHINKVMLQYFNIIYNTFIYIKYLKSKTGSKTKNFNINDYKISSVFFRGKCYETKYINSIN